MRRSRLDRPSTGRNATFVVLPALSAYKGRMSSGLPFRKMSGLGNEILVVDLRGGGAFDFGPSAVRAIAERPRSHFDQLMVLSEPRSLGT